MRNIPSALLLTIAILNGTARVVPQRSRAAARSQAWSAAFVVSNR